MNNILFLLVYVFGMVFGQVLFKRVSSSLVGLDTIYSIVWRLLTSFEFFAAVIIYGLLTVYWIWLLRIIPISYAYPFVALSIAIIVVLGWGVWNESLNWLHISGVSLILFGVVLIGLSGE